MTTHQQGEPADDTYNEAWFPQLRGVQQHRQAEQSRDEALRRLSEMPDDALAYALGEAVLYRDGAL